MRRRSFHRDLTNLEWANRLGRQVTIRTSEEVVSGRVNSIGSHLITVEKTIIKRINIICVRGES